MGYEHYNTRYIESDCPICGEAIKRILYRPKLGWEPTDRTYLNERPRCVDRVKCARAANQTPVSAAARLGWQY